MMFWIGLGPTYQGKICLTSEKKLASPWGLRVSWASVRDITPLILLQLKDLPCVSSKDLESKDRHADQSIAPRGQLAAVIAHLKRSFGLQLSIDRWARRVARGRGAVLLEAAQPSHQHQRPQ